jgi:hypothetical protein
MFSQIFGHHDTGKTVGKTVGGIHTEDVPGDIPEFKRVYSAKLAGTDRHCTLKVTMRTWSLGLSKSAELTQDNGRWVSFDPDNIAEKILDRALVPLIQQYVDEIYSLDEGFRKSDPAQFIDERGVAWRRVEGPQKRP